jgi:hypothetical protein
VCSFRGTNEHPHEERTTEHRGDNSDRYLDRRQYNARQQIGDNEKYRADKE